MDIERWLYSLPQRLRYLFRSNQLDQEIKEELREHLEQQVRDNVAKGMSPGEARHVAIRMLGGVSQVEQRCRDARGGNVFNDLTQDLRYGLRQLSRSPGFAALALATLALGIGATTAVFSVINAVLLRALPYRDPGQLVFLWEPNLNIPGVPLEAWGPFNGDFYDWKQQSRSFTHIALFTVESLNLSVNETAVRVSGSRVTGDFFQLLGVAPVLGRAIGEDDDQDGKGQVAVISHALWQSQFGSDPHAIGKEILLNARSYRIVGVMPIGFAFPHGAESLDTAGATTDVWIPCAMTVKERASREDDAGNAIGRLRPGVSPGQAQTELNAITVRLNSLHPAMLQNSQAIVQPFDVSITGASRRVLLIFMGAVILVLLIACSNVASLVLARATGRTQEVAVRAALGASRSRLIRQLLTESLCLAGAGGILGVLTAYLGLRVLLRLSPGNLPRFDEISIDIRVLVFAVSISIVAAVLFGLFPALSASRSNLNDAFKTSANRSVKGSGGSFQQVLMIGEVALTIVLLASSGLLIRSFIKLRAVDKGFSPSSTVTMNIHLDERYTRPEQRNQFFQTLIQRTTALPGVQAVGAINHLPLGGGQSLTFLVVEGNPFDAKTFFEERSISPGYFFAMGIPLIEGRFFANDDASGRPRVAIVSRSFARRYFPGQSAIGKHFSAYDEATGAASRTSWTIVGVVGNVRQMDLESTPPMQIYTPLWQGGSDRLSVVARTSLAPSQLASEMRSIVRNLDPAVAVADVQTMSERISAAQAERRFETVLLTAFGGIALFLSLVGLYGLIAYSVQQRTAEIGIRMALGAQRSNVMSMVLKEGLLLALGGIALGSLCALVVTRLMTSMLYQTDSTDPKTFFTAASLFAAIALVACCVPAMRATRIEPMTALRHE